MCSLEQLCLNIIVKNFPRLNFAFTSSKNSSLQRNFKFLQRRYTDYLARELLKDERNTDEYFDILINENLKYLEFDCFRNSPYLDSIDEIFCRLPNLTKVSFSICGDEVLKSVANFCSSLVEIVATNAVVSDIGVKYLCENRNGSVPCPKIKNIFLKDSTVTDDGVKHLIQHLASLQKLEYFYLPRILYSLHKEDLSKCLKEHSYNLTELCLRDCAQLPYFTDVLKSCVTVCPKLEVIYCQVLETEQLDAFKCINLKKLKLECLKRPMNVDNLLKVNGRNLTFLSIFNCTVSASVLAEHCPALEVIELVSVHFRNVDVQLTFLNLTKCSIYENDSEIFNLFFSSSPRLEVLVFCSMFKVVKFKNENFVRNGSSVIQSIEFELVHVEMNYLRSLLLTYNCLRQLLLRDCLIDVTNARKILSGLAQTLPNRPNILERSNAPFVHVTRC